MRADGVLLLLLLPRALYIHTHAKRRHQGAQKSTRATRTTEHRTHAVVRVYVGGWISESSSSSKKTGPKDWPRPPYAAAAAAAQTPRPTHSLTHNRTRTTNLVRRSCVGCVRVCVECGISGQQQQQRENGAKGLAPPRTPPPPPPLPRHPAPTPRTHARTQPTAPPYSGGGHPLLLITSRSGRNCRTRRHVAVVQYAIYGRKFFFPTPTGPLIDRDLLERILRMVRFTAACFWCFRKFLPPNSSPPPATTVFGPSTLVNWFMKHTSLHSPM